MINNNNSKDPLHLRFISSGSDPFCPSSLLSLLATSSYSLNLSDLYLTLAFHSKCHHPPSCFQNLSVYQQLKNLILPETKEKRKKEKNLTLPDIINSTCLP